MLDFSKITAGKLELEEVAFNLNALLEDRCALAQQLLRSRPNVQFVYDPPTEATPIIIRSDPLRLRQVLDNLLGNAAKFTERGEVRLTLRNEEAGNGMVRLHFSVSDTGTGIAPSDLERLFQPYTQAERRTARKYGGTGLGLAICHSIVKLLGGKLEVNSRLGEGSTFSFTFQAPRAPEAEQLRIPGQFHVSLPTAELKKHFALLVDDTPTNLFLLETICQATGLPYRTAQNGLEAVQLVQKQSFDLIFMDIQMPVMDGYTAIREIRKLPGGATTHITALTASAYQEDVARALEAGANAFIPKPFERDQLLLCIADALGIQPQRKLLEEQEGGEAMEESTVRQMHEYMREQYRISLGEIKMVLAQTAADWRPLLDSLAIFANKGQADEVKAILHRLKGQLSSIGLPDFADCAATIMLDIQDGKPYQEDVHQLIDSLSAIFRVLEKQVTLPHGQA